MKTEDREEVRQMLTDVLSGHISEIIGRLNVLNANVARVESIATETKDQAKLTNGRVNKLETEVLLLTTEKTNGRVTDLEKQVSDLKIADLNHETNCPYSTRIKTLEDVETKKQAVRKFAWQQWLVASSVGAGLLLILQLIFKL